EQAGRRGLCQPHHLARIRRDDGREVALCHKLARGGGEDGPGDGRQSRHRSGYDEPARLQAASAEPRPLGRHLERGQGCLMSAVASPDVELRKVTKRFGDFVAVNDIDLIIEAGTFVTLLGPSGCGKTTTLRMIAGFEHPSAGEVLVRGKDVASAGLRDKQTRMVFQSYALFPHMTVKANVAYGLRMLKVARPEIET